MRSLLILLVLMLTPLIYGVTYTIIPSGGDYASFTDAINYVNGLATLPVGGIEFVVPGNLAFNELPDTLTVVATETSPIVFRKFGLGANPIIYNDTCPSTRGVIMIANSAWVTFDGIDIADPVVADANRFATGYYVFTGAHITIKNCHVHDFSDTGINVRSTSTYITILHNTITHTSEYSSPLTTINGINVAYSPLADQVTIERNTIIGLKTATSTLYGIHLGQINGKIINNFVSLTADNNDKIYAIRADSRAGKTIDIDFNTVLIGGIATDHGYALATFGGDGTSTFHIRNNIFLNTRTGFDQYCIYLALVSPNYIMDYNVYYSGDEVNTFLGRWFQTDISDFSNWLVTSSLDTHSLVKNINFINSIAGDLHLTGASIGDLDLSGEPIEDITTDIDGEVRFTLHPYRGADENIQTPLNASINFEPNSLNFGIVPIGSATILPMIVDNTGALPISVNSITTTTPYSLRFAEGEWSQSLTSFVLNPAETRTIEVQFAPSTMGTNPALLHITTNVPGNNVNDLSLNGSGGAPEIVCNPGIVTFGNHLIGLPTAPQILNIQNIGNTVLHLSTINVPNGFELRYPNTGSWTDVLSNLDVTGGQSIDIEVRFSPIQTIPYGGVITIVSNDADEANLEIPISGTGVALSPPLNLVGVAGNQSVSLSWDIPIVQSRDGRPLSSYRIYRDNAPVTETTNTTYIDAGLTNNNAYTYYVTALYSNPAGESAPTNSITVTPINPIPVMIVTPNSLAYGRVPRNTISDTLSVLIQNQGWVNLELTSVTTSVSYNISTDQITWNTNLTNLVIAPGNEMHLYVRFMPTTMEELNSQINITTNDPSHPQYQVTLLGTGTGIALTLLEIPFTGTYLSEGAWGDYDNDNDLDLLVTGYGLVASAGTVSVYRNDGNDQFTNIPVVMNGVGNSMANWVDFDRDGDLDIFLSGQNQFEVNFCGLYRNDNGLFNLVDTGITPLVSGSSEWGDFDNDGDPDLLMTGDELVLNGADIPHADIYRNDGNGLFTLINTGMYSVGNSDAKFCDWDNDGDLDVALTGSHESSDYVTKIYRNDGVMPFHEVYSAPVGLRYSDLQWGDNDYDGDADLLVTGSFVNESNSITRIYRNDGNSVFVEIDPGIPGVRQGDIVWTDLDNDGLLDIFMNGVFSNQKWLGYGYLSIGNEYTYADSVESLKYANILPGDYDNDNDIDFFQSGRYDFQDYRCTIFRNDNPNPQTPPNPPSNLVVVADTNRVTFTWNPGSDAETPTLGLTYNLFVGHSSTTDEHFTAMANISTGFRRIPVQGNMGQKTSFTMILPNGDYYWGLQTIDNSLKGSAFIQGTPFEVDGVGNNDVVTTLITGLGTIYPNPFNPETTISYNLKNAGKVRVDIYNLRGQLVKTLEDGNQIAGTHTVKWNGKDSKGTTVGSGIYFCRFASGDVKAIRKLSLIK